MAATVELFSEWKKVIREGVTSYVDVLGRLQDGCWYHRRRSGEEDDAFNRGFRVEIPLFWGTF